jgi:hypothetical protein
MQASCPNRAFGNTPQLPNLFRIIFENATPG